MSTYRRRPRLTPAAIALHAELAANPPAPYVIPPTVRRYPEGAWPDPCDHTGFPVFGTRSYVLAVILGDYRRMNPAELARSFARYTACEAHADETTRIALAAMRTVILFRAIGAIR